MEKETEFWLRDEFIRLGQLLKAAGLTQSGSDAKSEIQSGQVKVNGETELRRGRKLIKEDVVEYRGAIVKILDGHAGSS